MSTSNKGGAETTHAQHMRALDRIGRTTEPIKVFDKDFFHFVTTSRVAEKQMVIMMDANANIRDSNFTKRMQSKGLTDHLSHKTKKIHQLLFQWRDIIDVIFLSRTLVQLNGEYQTFDSSPGDHRGISAQMQP